MGKYYELIICRIPTSKSKGQNYDFKMEITIYHLTGKTSWGSPWISHQSGLWIVEKRIPLATLRRKECVEGLTAERGSGKYTLRFFSTCKGSGVYVEGASLQDPAQSTM